MSNPDTHMLPTGLTGRWLAPAFDLKYHARNNPSASRRDTFQPCKICGWGEQMAIHDPANIGTVKGWAHFYEHEPE
jgi:hypothetical protein